MSNNSTAIERIAALYGCTIIQHTSSGELSGLYATCHLLLGLKTSSLRLSSRYPWNRGGHERPGDIQLLSVRRTASSGLAAHASRAVKLYDWKQLPASVPRCAWYTSCKRTATKPFLMQAEECLCNSLHTYRTILAQHTKSGSAPAGVFLPPLPLKWRGFQKGTLYEQTADFIKGYYLMPYYCTKAIEEGQA